MTIDYKQWCEKNLNVIPLARALNSSLPEQYIGYYLQKALGQNVVEYQKHFDWLGASSLDIYVPSLQLAVEYDGGYFHANKRSEDSLKTSLSRSHGIYVIRILEQTSQQPKSRKHNEISYYYSKKYKNIDIAIGELFRRINKRYGLNLLCDIDLQRDEKEFVSYVQAKFYRQSVACVWPESADYWDEENPVTPFDVLCNSNSCYKFKCPHCGRRIKFKVGYDRNRKALYTCRCEFTETELAFEEALKKYKETGETITFDESLFSRRLYDRMASIAHEIWHCQSEEEAEMYKKLGFPPRYIDIYLSLCSLKSIEKKDDNDSDLRIHMEKELTNLAALCSESESEKVIKQLMWDKATQYKKEGQCRKAYYLFERLYCVGYQKAGPQMEECETLMNT